MAKVAGSSSVPPADRTRMWRAEELGGLELLRASFTTFAFTPHAHEDFMIAVTEGGVAKPTYRGGSHDIGPGDIIVLNPEEAHAGGPSTDAPWRYRGLYPRAELMHQIAREFPDAAGPPEFGKDIVRDAGVAGRLRRFHRISEAPESSALQRESWLVEGLVALVGRHAVRRRTPRSLGRERDAVRVSRAYLEEHVTENVSLTSLADLVGLSPFHLCRVFQRDIGLSPHAYQTQVRVRLAKELLRTGMPIASVAPEAGFYDQAHLTRHFKRVVGVTPGRYVRGGAA